MPPAPYLFLLRFLGTVRRSFFLVLGRGGGLDFGLGRIGGFEGRFAGRRLGCVAGLCGLWGLGRAFGGMREITRTVSTYPNAYKKIT